MQNPDGVVFAYTRSSRREGWRYLFLYTVSAILLLVVLTFFLPGLAARNPVFYGMVVGLLILVGIGVVFLFALPAILKKEEFSYVIGDDWISCISPSRETGASYNLALEDILAVEEYAEPGGKERWYIHTRQGERRLIPSDYGNPVVEIVRILVRLRPELEPRRI
jgi:hypothetical protein